MPVSRSGLSPGPDSGSREPMDGADTAPKPELLLSSPGEAEPNLGCGDYPGPQVEAMKEGHREQVSLVTRKR